MGLKGVERDYSVSREGAEPNSHHVTVKVLSKKEEAGWRVCEGVKTALLLFSDWLLNFKIVDIKPR